MKQALILSYLRGAVLTTLPPTTQLEPPAPGMLELLREFETVQENTGSKEGHTEFNSWLPAFYIQLFGSILIQLWLENTELLYYFLKYTKT